MAYNDNKARDRFLELQQRLREQKAYIEEMKLTLDAMESRTEAPGWYLPVPPPRSLLDQWRAGEIKLGPHMPLWGGPIRLKRLACIGCGCCRMMPKHLYCEQCLIGRRPWAGR